MAYDADLIRRAVEGYSIEVTPASAAKVSSFADHLPAGTTVNVTFLPGSDIEDTLVVLERLRGEGFEPVPHIAARSIESEEHLARYIDGMVTRASVEEVLVIGGGVDNPVGPYDSSIQVLRTGRLEAAGMKRIGVAGHPEGTPDISPADVATALAEKRAWAADTGVEMYIETQFCFDADAILTWERDLRAAGNTLPIRIGVPGIATLKTLLKFAQMSGIGPSMRVLTRQAANIAKLLTVQAPDRLVADLSPALADPENMLSDLHFYPFGGLAKTAVWANAVAAGEFEVTRAGFTVVEGTRSRIAS